MGGDPKTLGGDPMTLGGGPRTPASVATVVAFVVVRGTLVANNSNQRKDHGVVLQVFWCDVSHGMFLVG